MDPPYESSNTMTAFRIIESALEKGIDVNVFAFEGAVSLSSAEPAGASEPGQGHLGRGGEAPLDPGLRRRGSSRLAAESGAKLDWVNCGFCVDERGADNWVEGPRRGGPAGLRQVPRRIHQDPRHRDQVGDPSCRRDVLSVIDTAYRACQEEQDDAGLWFSAAVKNAGVDMTILLTGNAVSYAVEGHRTDAFAVAGGRVEHPFDPPRDIERMARKGVGFFTVREDLEERGIDPDRLVDAVEAISRSQLPDLIEEYDAIWHW